MTFPVIVLAAGLLMSSAAAPYSSHQYIPSRAPDRFRPCGDIPAYIAPYMIAASEEQGIPLETLAAVVKHESGYKLQARHENAGGTTDGGPGQLNSAYLAWFSKMFNGGRKIDRHAPESVFVVARILAWNRAQLGDDEVLWICAYNQGVGGVKQHGPNMSYYRKVMGGKR